MVGFTSMSSRLTDFLEALFLGRFSMSSVVLEALEVPPVRSGEGGFEVCRVSKLSRFLGSFELDAEFTEEGESRESVVADLSRGGRGAVRSEVEGVLSLGRRGAA